MPLPEVAEGADGGSGTRCGPRTFSERIHGIGAYLLQLLKSKWFWATITPLLIAFIIMISLQVNLQWFWLLLYAALTIPFAPFITNPTKFFRGGFNDDVTSFKAMLVLAFSVSISWVFAKSILNASLLGASYGITGGLAYASYYTSFPAVAIVIYFLRTRHGYHSLPEAIQARYGTLAVISFGLAVSYRLYQEVWSNALVVGGFFGPVHSTEFWLGCCLSTLIPVIYAFTGGMRASLMTDAGQMTTCIGLLIGLLIVLGINAPTSFGGWNANGTCALPDPQLGYQQCAALGQGGDNLTRAAFTYTNSSCNYPTIKSQVLCTSSAVGGVFTPAECALETQPLCNSAGGNWKPVKKFSLANGMDLLIVGLLQGCLSYPFFDPVLTDRAFLTEPKTMLKAFILGGSLAAVFILLFSFMGIFGSMVSVLSPYSVPESIYTNFAKGQPSAVAKYFGTAVFSITNIIFITQSLSTLDSTFTSAAKIVGPEFTGLIENGVPRPPNKATKWHLLMGRLAIIILPIIGMLPLLSEPTALEATTTSGTVVLGLGPPIFGLIFLKGYHPLTFHLPFWWGVVLAVCFQLSTANCCKNSINMDSWYLGGGHYAGLLGVNVIGTAVAWVLGIVTLLENPLGSKMIQDSTDGNNFVQAGKYLFRRCRRGRRSRQSVMSDNPSDSNTSASSTLVKQDDADLPRMEREL